MLCLPGRREFGKRSSGPEKLKIERMDGETARMDRERERGNEHERGREKFWIWIPGMNSRITGRILLIRKGRISCCTFSGYPERPDSAGQGVDYIIPVHCYS